VFRELDDLPALTRPAKRTAALLTKLLAQQLRPLKVPGVPDFNFSHASANRAANITPLTATADRAAASVHAKTSRPYDKLGGNDSKVRQSSDGLPR